MDLNLCLILILIFVSIIQVAPQDTGSRFPNKGIPVFPVSVKGEPGIPGFPGMKGAKGEPGEIGFPGRNGEKGETGLEGPPGETGDKGERGFEGRRGPPGIKGERGFTGVRGLHGVKGEPGILGSPGLPGAPGQPVYIYPPELTVKGDQGPPGEKGDKGFDCVPTPQGPLYSDDSVPLGKSKDKPAKSCEYLVRNEMVSSLSGKYFINEDDPFQVNCDFENNQTCLNLNILYDDDIPDKMITIDHAHENKKYLLTEKPFDIYSFYGINYRQLRWFQSQAKTKITQVIKFHCKNVVVKSSKESKKLRLVSWNQKYIHLEDTTLSIDDCMEFEGATGTQPKYSIIKLEGFPQYLPITGFKIRDIRTKIKQSFWVEAIQLCANF